MPKIPPLPVPAPLREKFKDYPEYLERLQDVLEQIISKAGSGTPMVERTIWALEGRLETFMLEAAEELSAAEASGDAEMIRKASKKDFAVGSARMNLYGLLDDEFDTYFSSHFPSGYIDRGEA